MENNIEPIKEAFFLGFMASREGFNGECFYPHASNNRDNFVDEALQCRQEIEASNEYKELLELYLTRVKLEIHRESVLQYFLHR